MLKQFVTRDIARPLARRVGTLVAGSLIGLAAVSPPEAQVQEVTNAVTIVILFGIDLLFSYLDRR